MCNLSIENTSEQEAGSLQAAASMRNKQQTFSTSEIFKGCEEIVFFFAVRRTGRCTAGTPGLACTGPITRRHCAMDSSILQI